MHESDTYLAILDEGQEKATREDILIFGEARFVDHKTIEVDSRQMQADWFFINAGCRPSKPTVSGIDAVPVLNSTTIMELDHVPDHLLVLGSNDVYGLQTCYTATLTTTNTNFFSVYINGVLQPRQSYVLHSTGCANASLRSLYYNWTNALPGTNVIQVIFTNTIVLSDTRVVAVARPGDSDGDDCERPDRIELFVLHTETKLIQISDSRYSFCDSSRVCPRHSCKQRNTFVAGDLFL